MDRGLAADWSAGELAAAVRDHLVDIHVELGPASGHPDVQRKHVVMLAREDFIADARDQFVMLIMKPAAGVVRGRRGPLQYRVGGYHLTGHQLPSDAKVFERALGL